MAEPQSEWIVVYRGVSASTVDVVEAMLQAQGLTPHRQGRTSPALAGVGMHAMEQRISVEAAEVDRARELLEEFDKELDDEALSQLESEALDAEPVAQVDPSEHSLGRSDVMFAVAVLAALAAVIWLVG